MFSRSISIVMPVYNEQHNISDVIKSIFITLPSITDDFEVIAVNDGSIDNTAKILKEIKISNGRLKVLQHLKNVGYGAALTTGFRNAEKELILMMDSDRQFDISEITRLLTFIEGSDIVAGFRIKRMDSPFRCFLGRFFNFIVRIIFGIKIRDINCGFKLFKAKILRNMRLTSKGALVNAEIMYLAKRSKAIVKEVGISHYSRIYGIQTGASAKVVCKAVLEALWLRINLNKSNAFRIY